MSDIQTVWIGPTPQEIEWKFSGARTIGIPMIQFCRYEDKTHMCRWFPCKNTPQKPYREYCSEQCSTNFDRWYWRMFSAYFSWEDCKTAVWNRDKGKCKICRTKLDRRANPQSHNAVEFDHIIPEDYALRKLGYSWSNRELAWKFLREILFATKNVRCLCHPCHKKVTANYNSKRLRSKPSAEQVQERHEIALRKCRFIFRDKERDVNQQSLMPFLTSS